MLFSRQDLIKIIVPLLIEQTLAVTIGIVDSVMVSSAGEAAVSGVSLVNTVNLLLIYVFSALAGGGSVIISQLMGTKNYSSAKEAAKQLIWVVLLVAALMMLIALLFRVPLLGAIFGSIEPRVMENAKVYFLFTAMSYPFLGIVNACAAILRAMGDSKATMYTAFIANMINVAGNAILIFVFNLGAAGAAIATLISHIVHTVMMLILIHDKKRVLYVERLTYFKPNLSIIKRICSIGIPNGLENGMFQLGKLITQSLVSGFGTVQIAANTVAGTLATLQYLPGNAIGLAMIIVVGRCIGAGEKEQAKKYAIKLLGITYGIIIAISVFMCVFSKGLIGFYNLSPQSAQLTWKLLIVHSICVCSVWPVAFTLPNSLRAASDVKYTMVLSIISMWIFRVGLSFVFGKALNLGVTGVWFAMECDWIFRAIVFGARYLKGKWLKKHTELRV